ncbi:MAG: ABC transporter ATP-binding protein, partial [Clostridiaceae bacterium]
VETLSTFRNNEKFSTDFEFTVKDIVLMGRHPYLKRFQEASESDLAAVTKAMELTGTLAFSDKKVTALSGGEAQRVSLARALAQDTPYIILDEPINHLDVSHQVLIMKILRDMVPEKTPIAVMHDINYSKEYSDYTILMDNGNVLYHGKPEEVLTETNLKEVYDIDFINLYSKDKDKNFIFPI